MKRLVIIVLVFFVILLGVYSIYRSEPFYEDLPKTSVLLMDATGNLESKTLLDAAKGTGICRYITSAVATFPSNIASGSNPLLIDGSSSTILNNLGVGRNLLVTLVPSIPLIAQFCEPTVTITLMNGTTVVSSQTIDASSGSRKLIFDGIQTGNGGNCSITISLNSSCGTTVLPNTIATVSVSEIQ